MSDSKEYELIIGLEVHAQLATKTKLFCGCGTDGFGSAPNTRVCPVCNTVHSGPLCPTENGRTGRDVLDGEKKMFIGQVIDGKEIEVDLSNGEGTNWVPAGVMPR